MARRTVAICDGKPLGIETIYTVINGAQVNIPEKLREVRAKSRNNELFCPCGCGANLILVAGDKNLREQHFRIKNGEFFNCNEHEEGKKSIESKIVLKCWLDDKLHDENLESRVPICSLSDSTRRYEFTFLSRKNKIAIDYCCNRSFLNDEKQTILDENSNGIKIIHMVDLKNVGTPGQYQEHLMKIQKRQGYCIYMDQTEMIYESAIIYAGFFEKDAYDMWAEKIFAEASLKDVEIRPESGIYISGESLDELYKKALDDFKREVENEKKEIETEKQKRIELNKRLEEEEQKRLIEWNAKFQRIREAERQRKIEEAAERQRIIKERAREWEEEQQRIIEERERQRREREEERQRIIEERERQRREREEERQRSIEEWKKREKKRQEEFEEQKRLKEEKEAERQRLHEEEIRQFVLENIDQQETMVIDSDGDRWIRCEVCGKIATDAAFYFYGGKGRINLGICKECKGK